MNFSNALHRFVKSPRIVIGIVLGLFDVITITLAFQLAYWVCYNEIKGFFFENEVLLHVYFGVASFWIVLLYLLKIAEIPRAKRYRVLFYEYLQSTVIIYLDMILIYFVFKLNEISRLYLLMVPLLGFFLLFFLRLAQYKLLRTYRSRGYNLINVIIMADDSAINFIDTLIDQKVWGYKIVAIFSDSNQIKDKYQETIIHLRKSEQDVLNDLLEGHIVDEVLYFKNKVNTTEIRQVIHSCEELGVVFRLKQNPSITTINNAVETVIYDYRFLSFINIPHNSFAITLKNVFDITMAFISICALSPFLLAITIAIKISSPGPAFFKQERIGLRGRTFKLIKFRTMVVDAEKLLEELKAKNEADGPAFKIKDDPRITPIGKILRGTGLDELPQLFNILVGEMSFIGPRPPLPNEIKQYRRWQLRRLSVKPGLSCFWQVQPNRHDIKFEKWMELDLAYIDNWSLRLDLLIFFRTFVTIFKKTGA